MEQFAVETFGQLEFVFRSAAQEAHDPVLQRAELGDGVGLEIRALRFVEPLCPAGGERRRFCAEFRRSGALHQRLQHLDGGLDLGKASGSRELEIKRGFVYPSELEEKMAAVNDREVVRQRAELVAEQGDRAVRKLKSRSQRADLLEFP